MSHSSEKRWKNKTVDGIKMEGISEIASQISNSLIDSLNFVEAKYLELQELYNYAGGTITDLANLLFKEEIADRNESVANTEEIAKTTDLFNAVTAAHEIYQAANNVAVTQEDRLAELRRMS